MYQDLWKTQGSSIINLFQKMTSNVTKFRQSIGSSPSQSTKRLTYDDGCNCCKVNKQRNLQKQFYSTQYQLVSKAAALLDKQGQSTLSTLLTFMADNLLKIEDEVSKELICGCQKKKLEQHEEMMHKITFLREENHKFFKMIQQKNDECQLLKQQIDMLLRQKSKIQEVDIDKQRSEDSISHLDLPDHELSSRGISSNSSRVSQFKVAWPELMFPLNQGTHRRYFQPSPGDHKAHAHSNEPLTDINMNHQCESMFRKSKIFPSSLQR